MKESEQYCYIGTKPCGCTVAGCLDMDTHKKDTAKFVSDCVKDGLTVERVLVGDARTKLQTCKCDAKTDDLPLFT